MVFYCRFAFLDTIIILFMKKDRVNYVIKLTILGNKVSIQDPCAQKAIFVPLPLKGASMRPFAAAPPSLDTLTGYKNSRSSPGPE